MNPNDAADVKAVHALQDAIKVEQKAAGKFAGCRIGTRLR